MAQTVDEPQYIQTVKIKDWDYIKSHPSFMNPVPDMEQYCGKEANILECVFSTNDPNMPNVYSIFEDGGKYWWTQDWFENEEDS